MEVLLIGLILLNIVILIFNYRWCSKMADCNERLDNLVSKYRECVYKIEGSLNDIDDICKCHEDDVRRIKAEVIAKAILDEKDSFEREFLVSMREQD